MIDVSPDAIAERSLKNKALRFASRRNTCDLTTIHPTARFPQIARYRGAIGQVRDYAAPAKSDIPFPLQLPQATLPASLLPPHQPARQSLEKHPSSTVQFRLRTLSWCLLQQVFRVIRRALKFVSRSVTRLVSDSTKQSPKRFLDGGYRAGSSQPFGQTHNSDEFSAFTEQVSRLRCLG
jgi:hypothetical protein